VKSFVSGKQKSAIFEIFQVAAFARVPLRMQMWYAAFAPLTFCGCRRFFFMEVVACQTCGLVQEVNSVPKGYVVKCSRCHFQIFHRKIHSRSRTLALSIAAGILYFSSNIYPIVSADYQGHTIETTIFQGITSLWGQGQYFIGGLVFFTSKVSRQDVPGILLYCEEAS
jgi:uncharacterized paraquat-inducible protein A